MQTDPYISAVFAAGDVTRNTTLAGVGDETVAGAGKNSSEIASYQQDHLMIDKAQVIMEGQLGVLFSQLVGVFYTANQMKGPMAQAYQAFVKAQVTEMNKTARAVIKRYTQEMAFNVQEIEDSKKLLEVARSEDKYMASSQGTPESVRKNGEEIAFSYTMRDGDPVTSIGAG